METIAETSTQVEATPKHLTSSLPLDLRFEEMTGKQVHTLAVELGKQAECYVQVGLRCSINACYTNGLEMMVYSARTGGLYERGATITVGEALADLSVEWFGDDAKSEFKRKLDEAGRLLSGTGYTIVKEPAAVAAAS